jgi:methionyl-tRNA formyltransferase
VRDVEEIDEIDLERKYEAGRLIDILKARTFPPYPGAFFRYRGRKIYLRLELLYEDQL